MRNRRASARRLTAEQSMFMHMGGLVAGYRGETEQDTERRLFGTAEAAGEAWRAHCDELLAEFPTPGRRIHGFWRYRMHCDRPPFEQEADLLRQLGELSAAEEEQLAAWAAMTPEVPADIALDHPAIVFILEDPNASAEARPEDPHTEAADRPTDQEAAQAAGERAPSKLITEDHTDVKEPPHAAGGTDPQQILEGLRDAERADDPEPGPEGPEGPGNAAPDHADTERVQGRSDHRDDVSGVPWPLQPDLRAVQGWETDE